MVAPEKFEPSFAVLKRKTDKTRQEEAKQYCK